MHKSLRLSCIKSEAKSLRDSKKKKKNLKATPYTNKLRSKTELQVCLDSWVSAICIKRGSWLFWGWLWCGHRVSLLLEAHKSLRLCPGGLGLPAPLLKLVHGEGRLGFRAPGSQNTKRYWRSCENGSGPAPSGVREQSPGGRPSPWAVRTQSPSQRHKELEEM